MRRIRGSGTSAGRPDRTMRRWAAGQPPQTGGGRRRRPGSTDRASKGATRPARRVRCDASRRSRSAWHVNSARWAHGGEQRVVELAERAGVTVAGRPPPPTARPVLAPRERPRHQYGRRRRLEEADHVCRAAHVGRSKAMSGRESSADSARVVNRLSIRSRCSVLSEARASLSQSRSAVVRSCSGASPRPRDTRKSHAVRASNSIAKSGARPPTVRTAPVRRRSIVLRAMSRLRSSGSGACSVPSATCSMPI